MSTRDYQKGYAAGRALARRNAKRDLWAAAAVAALPACLRLQGWTITQGGVKREATSVSDKAFLAACAADAVLTEAEKRGVV